MLDLIFSHKDWIVLNTSKPLNLEWDLKPILMSISYENRYSSCITSMKMEKSNYLGLGSQEDDGWRCSYVAYKQHFFYFHFVIKPFEKAELHSTNLVKDDKVDTTFTKQFKAVPLAFKMEKLTKNELVLRTNWLYLLKSYDRNLEDIVALVGYFWINRHAFIRCVFKFVYSTRWAIILFTVLVKLAMSPITYKSFCHRQNESIETWNQWARKKFKDPMKSNRKQWSFIIKQVWILWLVVSRTDASLYFLCFVSILSFNKFETKFLWADDLSLWLYLWVTISYSSIRKSY
jgi:YidC/Oxa1 family membrane protein insertase